MRHFKHNPAELKKHNLALRKLKKEYDVKKKKDQEARKQNPAAFAFQKALRENDPTLIQGLWRGMLHWKRGCDLAVSLGNHYFKDDFAYEVGHDYPTPKTAPWSDVVKKYTKTCQNAQRALQNQTHDATYLFNLYNTFWDFILRWKQNIITVTSIDPRLDDRCPQSIVVWRDESVLEEEYFFVATHTMPFPTLDDFAPETKTPVLPLPEPDVLPLFTEKALTKEEVFNLLPEKDKQGLLDASKPFASHYSIPKPQQDFYLPKPTRPDNAFLSIKIIQQTKRPPKQVPG